MKSNLLKAERIKRGWTQTRVAEALGVDMKTIGRWERGITVPYPYFRERLCLLFERTPEQLGLLSDDENSLLEYAASFGFQFPASDNAARVPLLADPSIPQPLENATSLVGRKDLLIKIKERILVGEDVILRAEDGLPGIGKTALAVKLTMDQQVRDYFHDGILWAGLGTHPNVLGHLARWGMLLGIMPSQVEDINNPESWGKALRSAIGSRRVLLIISDAWTAEDALSLQIGGLTCAHLVTTGSSEVAQAFDQKDEIMLPQMEQTERVSLLKHFVPELVEQDLQGAYSLVEAVGGLPLALTLMGSYLASQAFPAQSHPLQTALALLHDTEEHLRMSMSKRAAERSSTNPRENMPLSLHAVIAMCDQQLSLQTHATLHALTIFPPKPESFSQEAALAVTQQPIEMLDALCNAGLLDTSGPGHYLLHQAVADYVRSQSKVSTAPEQQVEGVNDFWLTNHIGQQKRNKSAMNALAKQVHQQPNFIIGKRDKITLSSKNIERDIPLKIDKVTNRFHLLLLSFLCLIIVSSGIYAVSLPLRMGTAKTDGLIGYWPLNEGSGTSTPDMSGHGNIAQINGARWTIGRLGNALSFNGSNNTVDISNSVVNTSTSFTVAAWVLLSDLNGFRTAVSQDGDNVSGFYLQFVPPNRPFSLSGGFAFSLVDSDSTSGITTRATSNFSPVVNAWYHLVGVYDARSAQSSLYVNGVLRSTQMVPPTWNASGETVIGRALWDQPTDFWSGKIDDVRLYNRALSATDVTNLYASFDK